MDPLKVTSVDGVTAVLSSPAFQPPPAPAATTGAAAALRSQMARFSSPDDHGPRRAALESTITSLIGFPAPEIARNRTLARLTGRRIEAVTDIGLVVPTDTLALALGMPESDLDAVREDVLALAKVIGRQEAPDETTDGAVTRLLDRFADHPAGAVAPVSLLYQNHDATAALLASALLADHLGAQRRSSLSGTSRVATATVTIAGSDIAAGSLVALDLESTGLEFGSGPHQCPGQSIALGIVAGIRQALSERSYRVIDDLIELSDDGRAAALAMGPSE